MSGFGLRAALAEIAAYVLDGEPLDGEMLQAAIETGQHEDGLYRPTVDTMIDELIEIVYLARRVLEHHDVASKALAADLYAKADEIGVFMDEHTERLDFEQYSSLDQEHHFLNAIAESLMTADIERFARGQLQQADHALRFIRDVIDA